MPIHAVATALPHTDHALCKLPVYEALIIFGDSLWVARVGLRSGVSANAVLDFGELAT